MRDYLHPFDGNSLILDLIRHPEAEQVLAVHAPTLHALAVDPTCDVRYRRLNELSWGVPRQAKTEAQHLGEKLRQVEL
ncbi:MAG: hypothetical protein IJ229_11225 [Clostridia bacterium]|nr:hypothetical protein [Clostridia bacterium]